MPEGHGIHRFLACRTCLEAERVLPQPPEVDPDGASFLERHAGHKVEALSRVGDAFLSDRPLWDPMATTYLEVTNGSEVLVVRSGRRSVEDPVERVLLPARLRLDHITVEFDLDLIRRALDAHFFPQAVRPRKLEQFLAMLSELCRGIDAERLDVVFDAAMEPHVQFARLPEDLHREVIARTAGIFDEWERERLRPFLAEASADDGLLTLRVTRSFTLQAA